ncbi:MAG: hypothetical protein AAGF23_13110 [Acidobacteriota bacterium]
MIKMKLSTIFATFWMFASLATTVISVPPAQAATIQVDGTCTLADAIIAANTDTATGDCPAGDAGADTLVLDTAVSLSTPDPGATEFNGFGAALPDVTDDLMITAGLADEIALNAGLSCGAEGPGPFFRLINLISGSLALEGLRLLGGCLVGNGFSGGMIRAEASTELTLDNVTIQSPTFIATSGSMRGGVIYSVGDTVTLVDTLIDGLSGEAGFQWEGGAVFMESLGGGISGQLSVIDSTFSNFNILSAGSLIGGAIQSRNLDIDGATFEDFTLRMAGNLQGGAVHVGQEAALSTIRNSFFRRIDGLLIDVPPADGSANNLFGGALHSTFGSEIMLSDSQFSDITMVSGGTCRGGAIYVEETSLLERFIVEDSSCQILENTVFRGGAAVYGNYSRQVY